MVLSPVLDAYLVRHRLDEVFQFGVAKLTVVDGEADSLLQEHWELGETHAVVVFSQQLQDGLFDDIDLLFDLLPLPISLLLRLT